MRRTGTLRTFRLVRGDLRYLQQARWLFSMPVVCHGRSHYPKGPSGLTSSTLKKSGWSTDMLRTPKKKATVSICVKRPGRRIGTDGRSGTWVMATGGSLQASRLGQDDLPQRSDRDELPANQPVPDPDDDQ